MTDELADGIRTKLKAREDAISRNWFKAITPSGATKEHKKALKESIQSFTSEAVGILLKKQFEQQKALTLGNDLARITDQSTDTIGRTVEVLTYELTRDLSSEELHYVHPNLTSLAASVSMGFFNEVRRSILEEQGRIKETLLQDLLFADNRLREVNEKLEARVQQRTFELNRLNEELKQQVHDRAVAERKLRDRENLLSVILDSSMVWIGLLDNEGRFLLTSKESLHFHGGKPTQVLGKHFWEMPWWGHSKELKNKVKKAIQDAGKGKSSKFDVYHLDKRGNKVDVEFSIRPVRDEEGKVTYLIPEGVNITERKEKMRDLERSRERLTDILENTKDILFSIDEKGKITYISPQIELFGHRREDLEGAGMEALMSLLHPDDRKEASAMFRKRIETKDETPLVYRIMDQGGGTRWVEETAMVITDGNGRVSGVNGVIRDITKRKLVEEELVKVNDVLKLVNRITRHDIKNRLAAAYGILGILAEREPGNVELVREALRSVEGTLEITRRMQELESLSHLGKGEETRPLAGMIEEAVRHFQIETSIKGDCMVAVDEAFISVIENLVSNSIKHGEATNVQFTIKRKRKRCMLEMKDDGDGIPDSIKHFVFDESFSWGPNRGSGLGLFIAGKVIKSYGGSIMVEDNKPKGTRFIIDLPVSREDQPT
jgi:PAS domain S-box-containing protein